MLTARVAHGNARSFQKHQDILIGVASSSMFNLFAERHRTIDHGLAAIGAIRWPDNEIRCAVPRRHQVVPQPRIGYDGLNTELCHVLWRSEQIYGGLRLSGIV